MNSADAGLRLRALVEGRPKRTIGSSTAYAAMSGWGLTRPQQAKALRRSGLYPLRDRYGRVTWHMDKPTPDTPERTPGRPPAPRSRRCCDCRKTHRPDDLRATPHQWEADPVGALEYATSALGLLNRGSRGTLDPVDAVTRAAGKMQRAEQLRTVHGPAY